ncbi:membrane protein [Mycobacterium phage Lucyedi]|nr:membrane protein [Mycobacterium phage Lucyedi]
MTSDDSRVPRCDLHPPGLGGVWVSGQVLVAFYASLAGLLSWICMWMDNREEDERAEDKEDEAVR